MYFVRSWFHVADRIPTFDREVDRENCSVSLSGSECNLGADLPVKNGTGNVVTKTTGRPSCAAIFKNESQEVPCTRVNRGHECAIPIWGSAARNSRELLGLGGAGGCPEG